MKVCWKGFIGNNHSWSVVARNISQSLIDKEHQVELFSTNGIKSIPEKLKKNIVGYVEENDKNIIGNNLSNDYDLELSYTAPKNFPIYLSHSNRSKKFGIWASEYNGINNSNTFPTGFAKNYKYTDKILAPSSFCRQGFINAGVSEDRVVVMPHGVDNCFISRTDKYELKTNKQIKFLLNVGGQLHYRKQVAKTLEAWGKAFTNKDDVVLIAKVSNKTPTQPFEQDWKVIFRAFKEKYKNHAQIIVITDFIDDISSLYRSCQIVLSCGQEGFNLPILEAMYSNTIPIALNYSGHLDFCNNKNSLLINGKLIRCPNNYQYWQPSTNALLFEPDIDHYVELLKLAANKKDELLEKFRPETNIIKNNYTWDIITDSIIILYKSIL